MIKTFSIARIAQSLGLDKVLTFRPLGKKAKEIIISEISELNPGAYVNLDFQNILYEKRVIKDYFEIVKSKTFKI